MIKTDSPCDQRHFHPRGGHSARREIHPGRRHFALRQHHEDLGISAMIPLLLSHRADSDRRHRQVEPFPAGALAHMRRPGHGRLLEHALTLFAAGMFSPRGHLRIRDRVCTPGNQNPKTTRQGDLLLGLLCVVVYTLVPFAFQGTWVSATWCIPRCSMRPARSSRRGVLGHAGAGIYSGTGVAAVMARWCMPAAHRAVVVIMLILALVLC